MLLTTLALLGAAHRALAQSSLTVSMAWEHNNPWIASSIWDFDDITHYEVGCDASADPDDCIVYTPFTLTQAPSFARFTTTLPGESDSSVIHFCSWSARTPGCGWSDNFADGTWEEIFWTPDAFSNTETVIPLVTSAEFLTLDEPSDSNALPTRTTSTRLTASMPRGPGLSTPTPPPDEEGGGVGGGDWGGFKGGFGGPGLDEEEEGHAERRTGHVGWVAAVAIAISAVLA